VLSHADLDHYNALPELLKQFSVARVYVSPQMFREQIAPLELLRTAIEASGVQLKNLASGDSILLSPDAKLNVLHPPWHGVAGNDNAHSIVLTIEYAGRRILLTGDLESAGMQRLLGQLPYDCDIALAPHHGSARSDPQDFSAWCRPEWLVISGSAADDESGSLSALYQSRGAAVLHTARHGAVQFDIRGEQITATHWRHGRWHSVVPQPRASLEHSAGADVP
jgi:competence protein ComEC